MAEPTPTKQVRGSHRAAHLATAPMLTLPDVRALRQRNLLLGVDTAGGRSITEVVRWLGAMQSQDLASGVWSLGVRTGATRAEVAEVLGTGAILRTWPMRGTLHLLPGEDASWMVGHFAQRMLERAGPRRDQLGLDQATLDRAADVLGDFLADGRARTRADCMAAMQAAGIDVGGQRGYYLLWYSGVRGLTCVGPNIGKEQAFALLARWAPAQVALDRETALATLAERYVRGRGPVTRHDLARWADLTLTDANAGLAAVPDLTTCTDPHGRKLVIRTEALDTLAAGLPERLPARALPGFDELVLGYRDRSAQLDKEHEPLIVPGGNGVFKHTLLLDGRVVGTWRRQERARGVRITASPFARLPRRAIQSLDRALTAYADHLELPPTIEWTDPPTVPFTS